MKNKEILDSVAADYQSGQLTDDCIPAPGYRDRYGYANFEVRVDGNRIRYKAHNYALRQAVGDPPPGKTYALHKCRTKTCCNPRHLYWGDAKQNAADRKRDGTETWGESHGSCKLTESDVLEIRRLYATGNYTHRSLAEMYGVVHSTIRQIVNREIWTHI